MKKLLLICNPVAGNGASSAALVEVRSILDSLGVDYDARLTQYPLHATELAREGAQGGYGLICAIGGDGTVREVALGLLGTGIPMGIVPCGTGNDFVRPLGIPTDIEAAVDILLNGCNRAVDAGAANEQRFVNVAGFGFDVDVLDHVEHYKKKIPNGQLAYLAGLLRAIVKPTLRKTVITIDDGEPFTKNALLVAAGNGSHFGGGMMVTPLADPSDGLLDICIIHDTEFPKMLAVLPKFLKGKHLGTKYVTYLKAKKMTAVCEPVSRLDVDGERIAGTPVTISILDKALTVRVKAAQA